SASKPIIIIIDGLDEWGKPMEQRILLDQLQGHLSKMKWIRVVIMSRPNSEIQKTMTNKKHIQSFDLSVGYTAHQDIETFFRERFADLDDGEISKSDINNLISKADGLFIWANTAMEFIESGMDMATNIQVVLQQKGHESEIEHPHARLFDLYGEVLKQYFTNRQSQYQCQLIVGSIISAYEPLTMAALGTMLQIGSNVTYAVVKKVIDVLKAVLYLNDGKVYYHLSLAEFLISEQCPVEFKMKTALQHQNLAKVCMKVLTTELKFNMCNLETSSILNHEIRDLEKRIGQNISSQLQYSAQWWAHHVKNAEATDSIDNGLKEFTSSCQLIFWLECMSLIGKVNKIRVITSKIKKWAGERKDPNLMRGMQELEKFVNVFFVALNESTPHLYVSGCALLPSGSALRKIIHCEQFVKVRRGGDGVTWEKILHVIDIEQRASSVAYSPDGQYVVSGSKDKTVRIWNAETGLQVGEPLKGHTQAVISVAYSPDGQYIVSGSWDMTVRIWNAETGQQVGEPLKGHIDEVTSVAYSPNGQYVLSGSKDKTVRIWNAKTGLQVGEPLKGHTQGVTSVAYTPDGQYVVSGSSDKTVRIWNAETGWQVGEPLKGHTQVVISVAYSPDGQYVLSGSKDKTVRIWNAETVAYSPDGQYVVSGSSDRTVRIWNAETVVYSPDGLYVVSGSWDKTVRIWNAETVAYSSDGQYVVSGSSDKTVRIWNAETGWQVGEPLKGHTQAVIAVAYSPDGQYVVSGSWDKTLIIWNAETGLKVGEQLKGHTHVVTSVAYSLDGQYVVSGSFDKTVRIWNAETGQQVGEPLKGHTNEVTSVAYSPDGQYVVSGSSDRTVRIWNAETGLQVGEPLKGHTQAVMSMAYSPDGQYVLSGSWDKTVRIWSAETSQQVGEPLKGHTQAVISAAYSPDGQYVVSGSWDKTVRIWNTETGQQVGEPLKGHTQAVISVAYSPDGQYVVSGSSDRTVRIWNAELGLQVGEPLKGHTNLV
ncbi:hypothetical protein GYMLUDRAFT_141365, partial [Collybiopsis luxurians FD-317 M1]